MRSHEGQEMPSIWWSCGLRHCSLVGVTTVPKERTGPVLNTEDVRNTFLNGHSHVQ